MVCQRRENRCIISFLYIKPQPDVQILGGVECCIISFLYIKPQQNAVTCTYLRVVCYRLSSTTHTTPTLTQVSNYVVLYRFSTSNHNNLRSSSSNLWLYYIVSLHQTTTEREFETIMLSLYYIVSLHQTTTATRHYWTLPMSYYIVSLHQTTTRARHYTDGGRLYYIVSLHQTTTRVALVKFSLSCIISFLYIKPQRICL